MTKSPGSISYKAGDFFLVPKKHTIGKKLSNWGYLDRTKTELSDRTFKPQKVWFEVPEKPTLLREHERRGLAFKAETKLIWTVFDTPELVGMLMHDETIKGTPGIYSREFLEQAQHWAVEARYWRCIGISKPFFTPTRLRAHCWEDGGLQVGTLRLSQAMKHALMDLERAYKRQEAGLEPNYVWEQWTPSGFADGSRSDYLPRFQHNPYVDPDGVEVGEIDVAAMNTHDAIKERYNQFIAADPQPFAGCFLSSTTHGHLDLDDIHPEILAVFKAAKEADGEPVTGSSVVPDDMRSLMHLVANEELLNQLGESKTWKDIRNLLADREAATNEKINAAYLLQNTRHDANRIRSFYEEKCGFSSFSVTPDRTITGAVLAYLADLQTICVERDWGRALAEALSDKQREAAIGSDAFRVYKAIEELTLDRRRRMWATRFAGDANEERALDYMLESFGKRQTTDRNKGSLGQEFDREKEPIGRHIQRRVVDADRSHSLAALRKGRGRVRAADTDAAFRGLHEKQLSGGSYFGKF
jgi:hypothetical protein